MRLARDTAGFIESTQDQPYFAMLSFYAVHGPIQTTEPLWQKYRDAAPPAPTDGNRFKVDRTMPVRQIQDNPVYAGMMETLDDAIGVVIKTLKATGDLENTIVIFTGDNAAFHRVTIFQPATCHYAAAKAANGKAGSASPTTSAIRR